jgi:hypothetical protein
VRDRSNDLQLEQLVDQGLRPMAEGASTRIKTLIDPRATASRPSETTPRPA